MKADVRDIEANDPPSCGDLRPGSTTGLRWFTVSIGLAGSSGADLFQVAIATVAGIRDRRDKSRKFVGLVVDRLDIDEIERTIRGFVSSLDAGSWEGLVEQLCTTMTWEYAGLGPHRDKIPK